MSLYPMYLGAAGRRFFAQVTYTFRPPLRRRLQPDTSAMKGVWKNTRSGAIHEARGEDLGRTRNDKSSRPYRSVGFEFGEVTPSGTVVYQIHRAGYSGTRARITR